MKTVKAKVYAYMWDWQSPEILQEEDIATQLIFKTSNLMGNAVCVGDGEVTISLYGNDTILTNKVMALRQEKAELLSETRAKEIIIDSKIQNLLAITYIPEESGE